MFSLPRKRNRFFRKDDAFISIGKISEKHLHNTAKRIHTYFSTTFIILNFVSIF